MKELSAGTKVTVGGIGATATILAKLYVANKSQWMYMIQLDGNDTYEENLYPGEILTPIVETTKEYRFTVRIEDNVAICRMYYGGDEIGKGHGHIIHSGDLGIAQAVSYGFKKLYEKMNGGIV